MILYLILGALGIGAAASAFDMFDGDATDESDHDGSPAPELVDALQVSTDGGPVQDIAFVDIDHNPGIDRIDSSIFSETYEVGREFTGTEGDDTINIDGIINERITLDLDGGQDSVTIWDSDVFVDTRDTIDNSPDQVVFNFHTDSMDQIEHSRTSLVMDENDELIINILGDQGGTIVKTGAGNEVFPGGMAATDGETHGAIYWYIPEGLDPDDASQQDTILRQIAEWDGSYLNHPEGRPTDPEIIPIAKVYLGTTGTISATISVPPPGDDDTPDLDDITDAVEEYGLDGLEAWEYYSAYDMSTLLESDGRYFVHIGSYETDTVTDGPIVTANQPIENLNRYVEGYHY